MIFNILTLFPEIFKGYLESSIIGRAVTKGLITVNLVNIRDYALDKHRNCDDYTYGGGAGMVLKPEPLAGALNAVGVTPDRSEKGPEIGQRKRCIYLTPSGSLLDQKKAEELAEEKELVLICGRYEGVDQRILDSYVTNELSIGDYVLSGGEVAAMVVLDSVSRLLAGVIKSHSLKEESFGLDLLEYPQYTRPVEYKGKRVPEVLLSGNHAKIAGWRLKKSLARTLKVRPELLMRHSHSREEIELIEEIIDEMNEEGEGNGSY